ncbi:MAG: hypothetical protein LBC07_04660, partial [Elusimicrobiota bacterium]|nr:hypothetical protein [Elusimicrobiota bacterium]
AALTTINNSTAIFAGARLSGNLNIDSSSASFAGEVLTSSVSINNSITNFNNVLMSSGIFISNSLADFADVSGGSITFINSSATFKSLFEIGINFERGDIFAQNSFVQISGLTSAMDVILNNSTAIFSGVNFTGDLSINSGYASFSEAMAAAFVTINNSTAIFAGASLSGNLDIDSSSVSFAGAVLTSSVSINNSTTNFNNVLRSSGIFISNSLADFADVSGGSITFINSSATFKLLFDIGINFERGDIFAQNSFVQISGLTSAMDVILNNSTAIFSGANFTGDLSINSGYASFSEAMAAAFVTINNSTAIFAGASLSGNLDINISSVSFAGSVLASSVSINNSTSNFNNLLRSSGIFITNSIADFAGVSGGSITFINSSANFNGNAGAEANFAGDIFAGASFIQFLGRALAMGVILDNSTAIFAGADFTGDFLINASFASFSEEMSANNIIIDNSTASFAGAALFGNLDINISSVSFDGDVLTSSVSINNSTTNFNNVLRSSGIFINNSLTDFAAVLGGSITFINSTANFSAAGAAFSGDIFAQNSFVNFSGKTEGGNSIFDNSTVVFEDNSLLKDTQISGVSLVNFKSAVSTLTALNVLDSTFSLRNEIATSSLYVTGDFQIENSYWVIDAYFDMENKRADWIWVGGNFSVSSVTLIVNELNDARTGMVILSAPNSIDFDIETLYVRIGYNLRIDANKNIILAADNAWNTYVRAYLIEHGNLNIELKENARAIEESKPRAFGETAANNFALHGSEATHLLDSSEIPDLGFIFKEKTVTIATLTFTHFYSTTNFSVMYSSFSTLTFKGNIEFTSNTSTDFSSLYAIGSSLSFVNATVEFSSNTSIRGSGGAIWGENTSVIFVNSTAVFTSNQAGDKGGAIYLNTSTLAFIKTDALFEHGDDDSEGSNNVYLNNSRLQIEHENNTVRFLNKVSIMDSSQIIIDGVTEGNIGFVEISGDLIFDNITNFELRNFAFAKIINTTFTYFANSDPIKMSASTIAFTNSSITFLNSANIEIDAESTIIFEGNNFLTKAFTVTGTGNGFIEKVGDGLLFFAAAVNAPLLDFTISGGSLAFSADASVKDFHIANATATFNGAFSAGNVDFTNSFVNFPKQVKTGNMQLNNSHIDFQQSAAGSVRLGALSIDVSSVHFASNDPILSGALNISNGAILSLQNGSENGLLTV